MNRLRATYETTERDYTISVDYTFHWEDGDYITPGAHDIEVTEVYVNGCSIPLRFFNDYIYESLEDDIIGHALENK
tara:strand:+ start:3545 stop:3772 length:228 start_codon:yes stop_codon:yes gene_type:complete